MQRDHPAARQEMLAALGVDDVEALLGTIPADVRVTRDLQVAGPLPEAELRRRLEELKSKRPRASFVGAGLYPHYIPVPVDSLAGRSEWVTSYTPYQAELAQGTLAMYYEFQSYVAMLTGQEIANGGLYDGSTALAEGVLMAMRVKPKHDPVVYVSAGVHPEYQAVLRTYMNFVGIEVAELPLDPKTGRTVCSLDEATQRGAAAIVVQSPNFFGVVEDLAGIHPDAMTVGVCTEALSMAILEPLPVKIAVGEFQSFGIPMQLGGPTAGFMATREEWVRKLPGRLVGKTIDAKGEEAYCITLATREQFIRREKATSNICTASGLMCLRATIYLSLLGRKGIVDVAEKNAAVARYFAKGLAELGLKTRFTGPFFNEFVVDASGRPELHDRLRAADILLGLPLGERFPDLKDHYLVCATEVHYASAESLLQEIKRLVQHS
ncbi:MAG: aminomethyl-transferring glycine dehydrogenase subunit GcvPA [Planctomycetota bacterium]